MSIASLPMLSDRLYLEDIVGCIVNLPSALLLVVEVNISNFLAET